MRYYRMGTGERLQGTKYFDTIKNRLRYLLYRKLVIGIWPENYLKNNKRNIFFEKRIIKLKKLIAVIIFFIHIIFAFWAFSKSYQTDGWLQAFLNLAFIVTLFSVGWTIADLFMGMIIPVNGYIINTHQNALLLVLLKLTGFYKPLGDGNALLLPKDTLSLILLSTIELFFYKFYFRSTKKVS